MLSSSSAFFTQRSQRLPCLLQINVGLALFKRLNGLGNTCSRFCQPALCFMELAQIQIRLTENRFGTDFLCRIYRRVQISFRLPGGEGDRFNQETDILQKKRETFLVATSLLSIR